ncbi:MAG: M23 family metallopeptidase [Gammaproteobacteria bacterium]|nr:M23 family metallopeptidase [Gammaproteobacteria bacterium]
MEPVIVEFPLRGEWIAPNTPGYKIPSHGTDLLAQTYAYDFMQIDWRYPKSFRCFKKTYISALLFGVPLNQCLGWSQPIYAPFSGEVIEAEDGVKERDPVHAVRDLSVVLKNSLFFKPPRNNFEIKSLLGNYIILKSESCYAFFAHARTGSIRVKSGDSVCMGQQLAEVGHTGNSTAPHLHFHLMDSPVLATAKGIPCCFREYELFQDGVWSKISNGIPGRYNRIRLINT